VYEPDPLHTRLSGVHVRVEVVEVREAGPVEPIHPPLIRLREDPRYRQGDPVQVLGLGQVEVVEVQGEHETAGEHEQLVVGHRVETHRLARAEVLDELLPELGVALSEGGLGTGGSSARGTAKRQKGEPRDDKHQRAGEKPAP
jgi:hypothetical protein